MLTCNSNAVTEDVSWDIFEVIEADIVEVILDLETVCFQDASMIVH